jgi:hypothetical protein
VTDGAPRATPNRCTPSFTANTETDMLTDIFPFLAPRNQERSLPERLRRLADDIGAIRDGAAPLPDQIDRAPLLTNWGIVVTPLGVRLVGIVSGHPRHGNCTVMTSQIWVADSAGAWVRTLSRFYKLGEPAVETAEDGPRHV